MPGASSSYTLVADFLGIEGMELILMLLEPPPSPFLISLFCDSSISPIYNISITFLDDIFLIIIISPRSRILSTMLL